MQHRIVQNRVTLFSTREFHRLHRLPVEKEWHSSSFYYIFQYVHTFAFYNHIEKSLLFSRSTLIMVFLSWEFSARWVVTQNKKYIKLFPCPLNFVFVFPFISSLQCFFSKKKKNLHKTCIFGLLLSPVDSKFGIVDMIMMSVFSKNLSAYSTGRERKTKK